MNSTALQPKSSARPVAQPRKNFGLLGVGFFIVSESMFFLGLFLAWYYLRATNVAWPPYGVQPPSIVPAVFNTLIALVSTGAVVIGTRAIARGDRRGLLNAYGAASVLGLIFMAIQIAEFSELSLLAQGSAYGSTFTFLLLFHVARVFVGVALMVVVLVRALIGQFSQQRRLMVQGTAMYWFFITGVWLVVFAVLYLVK